MKEEITFPSHRDIYTSGEIASMRYRLRVREVQMIHMRQACAALVAAGAIRPVLRDGAKVQIPWPGAGRSYGLYSVRDHEKYEDFVEVIAHLTGKTPPEDTMHSEIKRKAFKAKKENRGNRYTGGGGAPVKNKYIGLRRGP